MSKDYNVIFGSKNAVTLRFSTVVRRAQHMKVISISACPISHAPKRKKDFDKSRYMGQYGTSVFYSAQDRSSSTSRTASLKMHQK
jgi:hypothetical protein